jgi:hypothetical protein
VSAGPVPAPFVRMQRAIQVAHPASCTSPGRSTVDLAGRSIRWYLQSVGPRVNVEQSSIPHRFM